MRYKKILFLLTLSLTLLSCGPALRVHKVVDGELEKLADIHRLTAPDSTKRVVQGMDICGDRLFIGFDGGYCRVVSLKDLSIIGEFPFGSNVPSNHCGNLDFGVETPQGSAYPALYVSGDLKTFSCYVEAVSDTSATLIQTIKFDLGNGYNGSQVIMDHKNKIIYYQQRKLQKIGDKNNTFAVYKFPLPPLSAGDVVYTEADALGYFELPVYKRIYQGAEIRGGLLYIVNGYLKKTSGEAAELTVFDLNSGGKVVSSRSLSSVGREPQGCSFYKGRLYILFDNSLWMIK